MMNTIWSWKTEKHYLLYTGHTLDQNKIHLLSHIPVWEVLTTNTYVR